MINNLSQAQRLAVKTEKKHVSVLAGAGSGKTRVFVERVVQLLSSGVSKETLFISTFTRKAANEVAVRLREEHNIDNLPWLGTMHAMALKYIRQYAYRLGYDNKKLHVISQKEFDMFVRNMAVENGIYKKGKWKYPKREIDKEFDRFFNTGIGAMSPLHDLGKKTPCFDFFNVVLSALKRSHALPYGQILVEFNSLIPKIEEDLYLHSVLIDETQDMNAIQWEILMRLIRHSGCSTFLVGDPDQAVYEWRGAEPSFFCNWCQKNDVFMLEVNYRSYEEIVETANKLIEKNSGRITKKMTALHRNGDDMAVRYVRYENIAGFVGWLRTLGGADISLILCRTHRILNLLADAMKDAGMNVKQVGASKRVTEDPDFVAFNALVRCMDNPYDDWSFGIANNRLIDIPDEVIHSVKAETNGDAVLPALRRKWRKEQLTGWAWKEDRLCFLLGGDGVEADEVKNIIHLADMFLPWPEQEIVSHVVEKICLFALGSTRKEDRTYKTYLDFVVNLDEQDDLLPWFQDDLVETPFGVSPTTESGTWHLSTIHAAKGLESSVVILFGANEGDLPIEKAIKSGDIDSERRLAYVAFTRAEDVLIVAHDARMNPSRFLLESEVLLP